MMGDIEKAFARQGSEVHLCELRAGVLPLYVTLPTAFVCGFLLSLFPWALGIFLRLFLALTSSGSAQAAPRVDHVSFVSALGTAWPYGLAFGAVCVGAALLRRYSAGRNKYLVLSVGQFAEFRASYGEVATALGVTAVLLILSETARYFNILVLILSPIIGMVLQDIQDIILRAYAHLSSNHVAENLYSVWELLQSRDDARSARIEEVGAECGGRVLILNGKIPDELTMDFFSRLPRMIHGVDRVIVNGQELRSRVPLRPTDAS